MPYGIPPYGLDLYGNPVDPGVGDLLYVELPGVYIDSLVFDEVSEGLFVFNAVPAPETTENPRGTNIDFDIFDTSGSNPDVSSINVTINGVPAVVNGAFVGPYNGAGSVISGGGSNTVHITIDPQVDFESEQIVTVAVTCVNDAVTYELDISYEFKIEDFTPPILLSAVPVSEKVVRLTFNEPMKVEDASASDDALNHLNYAFTALTIPAVPVIAVSCSRVSSAIIDVHLDTEITPGATYKVVVTNATDIHGNVIEP